eukprot:4331698-Prymnesium_polylepis.2
MSAKPRPISCRRQGRVANTAAREPTTTPPPPSEASRVSSSGSAETGVAPSASMSSTRSPRAARTPAACQACRRRGVADKQCSVATA